MMTNTLAYYGTELIAAVKSFMIKAPGPNVIKLFTSIIYEEARVYVRGMPF